jgi:hypothetical protein
MLKSSSVRLISICDDCATQPSFFLRFKDSKFCTPDTTTPYLNLPEVKAAFHTLSNITWTECRFKSLAKPLSYFTWFCLSIMQQKQCFSSNDVGVCSVVVNNQYSVASVVESMLPVYRFLQGRGLKMWIYSGDIDGVVPTTGTRYWLKELNFPIEVPWYPWNHSTQVGGWTQVYRGLTFVTVRNAGHMVPADKPEQGLAVFRSFLAGNPLPSL